MATPAGEAWIEGDPRGQLALFDVPERVPTDSIALTDTSPRANGERPSLTLGEAARGLEVAHFIRWFRNEYGATTATLRDYEAILGKLALDHADLELADFEPPAGTVRLREFIDTRWGDAAARTRKKVRAVLMSSSGAPRASSSSRETLSSRSGARGSETSNGRSSTVMSGSSPPSPSCATESP